MSKQTVIHVPASHPLCAELQGGHDSYSEGLVLSTERHYIGKGGDWLVNVGDETPERDARMGRTIANVHPVQSGWDETKRVEGRWVYAVRFWQEPYGWPFADVEVDAQADPLPTPRERRARARAQRQDADVLIDSVRHQTQVYLDRLTGNHYAVYEGALYSVNAVRCDHAPEDIFVDGGSRLFHGEVLDYRWRCPINNDSERRAARHFIGDGRGWELTDPESVAAAQVEPDALPGQLPLFNGSSS